MLKTITFDKFDVGLDLRKGASVSDANRLRQLKNAYVTTGKVIRKRPGLTLVANLEPGTKGLIAGQGVLNTFYESGVINHANSLLVANKVTHPTTSQAVKKIHHGDIFSGYIYVSVEYVDGSIKHHYLDGSTPTHITDAKCPNTAAWIKIASKVWTINGDTVAFSATNLPRNWTLTDDAGFLPTGLQQRGAVEATGLGQRDRDLIVYFSDSAQVWVPDPDPALHVFKKPINGVGTLYPRSISQVSDDALFLSNAGFRSISQSGRNDNLTDIDIGSPIDSVVTPLLLPGIDPVAAYYAGGGQYWCAIGNRVFTYTYSRSTKISAWSEYEFNIAIDDLAELNGTLYLRSGDTLYKVDKTMFQDDGTVFNMVMEMPFLDFKKPGVLKQIVGVDAVVQGSVELQLRYDARHPELITAPIPLSNDTRPGEMNPVGVMATSIAPVLTSNSNSETQIDSLTFYYEELGMMS